MAGTAQTHGGAPTTVERGRSLAAGALLGAGLMGAIDEIVFHQLLHWHHFYDRSTPARGLVSDGVLHALTLSATVIALFLLGELRRRHALDGMRWIAGLLLGLGGFQLFDGLVDHKLLEVHQVRYDVELLPYDLAWNGAAAVLIIAGLAVLARAARRRAGRDSPSG
jgi:uncharacterized membrane protein